MSDETTRKLQAARKYEKDKIAILQASEQALLSAVAADLPRHAEKLARSVAHKQPDVTRSLGREGVTELRAEIERRASELANELEGAVSALEWPVVSGEYDRPSAHKVQSALFKFLYGSRVNSLAAIFGRFGFDVGRNGASGRTQGLVLPQWLYSEEDLAPQVQAVVSALRELYEAQRDARKAKEEDDRDTVDSLWE